MFDTFDVLFFMDRYKKELATGVTALLIGYQLINNFYFVNDKKSKEVTKNVK